MVFPMVFPSIRMDPYENGIDQRRSVSKQGNHWAGHPYFHGLMTATTAMIIQSGYIYIYTIYIYICMYDLHLIQLLMRVQRSVQNPGAQGYNRDMLKI